MLFRKTKKNFLVFLCLGVYSSQSFCDQWTKCPVSGWNFYFCVHADFSLLCDTIRHVCMPLLNTWVLLRWFRLRAVSLLLKNLQVRVFEQRSCEGAYSSVFATRVLATHATSLLKYFHLRVSSKRKTARSLTLIFRLLVILIILLLQMCFCSLP